MPAKSFDSGGNQRRTGQEDGVSLAWVWSQYKGELSASDGQSPVAMKQGETGMTLNDRTKRGLILAVAALAGLISFWLAALLLIIAALLIAWGQQPKQTEEFIGGLPFGEQLLKALTQLDEMLSSRTAG